MSLRSAHSNAAPWTVQAFSLVVLFVLKVLGGGSVAAQTTSFGFEFTSWPSRVTAGVPFPVEIRSLPTGAQPGPAESTLHLTAQRLANAPVILSEVTGTFVEITSTGLDAVDVSGWQIQILPREEFRAGRWLTLPSGTLLPGGGVLTWSSEPVGEGIHLPSERRFDSPESPLGAVILRNAKSEVVDSLAVSRRLEIGSWTGSMMGLPSAEKISLSRRGMVSQQARETWDFSTASPGRLNPGLMVPWARARSPVSLSPERIELTQEVWNGSLTIHQSGVVRVSVFQPAGWGTESPVIQVDPPPSFTLSAPPSALLRSEARPGAIPGIEVVLATALPNDLRLTVTSSDPAEIAGPVELLIPAGQIKVDVPLTNFDDSIGDGAASVRLNVSAPGFEPAELVLVNADDETGRPFLLAPPRLFENSGPVERAAQIQLPFIAAHDVAVELTADAPLQVPDRVVIERGSNSAMIPLVAGDSASINHSSFLTLRATVPGWDPVEQGIVFHDDEDRGLKFHEPLRWIEGQTNWLEIQLLAPREAESVLYLDSVPTTPWFPAEVPIAPGVTFLRIPVQIPDNTTTNNAQSVTVCASPSDGVRTCAEATAADDEVLLTGIEVYRSDVVARSGHPYGIRIVASNPYHITQITNLLVHLSLNASPQIVRLDPEFQTLQLTNGEWSGTVVIRGEAEAISLVVEGGGLRSASYPISVADYHDLGVSVADYRVHPVTQHLLLLENPAQNGEPGHLVELDPKSGLRLRALELSKPAVRLAVSADGTFAWLSSASNTLQRIDLARWARDREVTLEAKATPSHLIILPGNPERVIFYETFPGGPFQLGLVEDGQLLSTRAPAEIHGLLAAGPEEFYTFTAGYGVRRYRVRPNALNVEAFSQNGGADLLLDGSVLYAGGILLDPTNLTVLREVDGRSSFVPMPAHQVVASVSTDWPYLLTIYDGADWHIRGQAHFAGGYLGSPSQNRLQRWGERGLAALSEDGRRLVIRTCPFLELQPTDLELTVHAPPLVDVPFEGTHLAHREFEWVLGITNRGNARARSVTVRIDSERHEILGPLNPGEGYVYRIPKGVDLSQLVAHRVEVEGSDPDPHPENNVAFATTEIRIPAPPGLRRVLLKSLDLIASADGTRLYAALARQWTGPADGVAEIDPATGNVLRILTGVVAPSRLAISTDGRSLYAQDGFQSLVRWNLLSGLIDLRLSFSESIHDFLCLDDPSQGLVVATTGKVSVFDDALPRPEEFAANPTRSYLTRVGSRLWVYDRSIQELRVSPSGLVPVGPSVQARLEPLANGVPGDGRRFYFQNTAFELSTGQPIPIPVGSEILTEPSKGVYYALAGGIVTRFSTDNLEQQAILTIDPTLLFADVVDLVRWGARGIAFRTGTAILMTESSVVPLVGQADLGVSILADPDWQGGREFEHQIRVTNHSEIAASSGQLEIRLSGQDATGLSLQGAPSFQAGGTFLVDLPELASKETFTVRLHGAVQTGYCSLLASVVGGTLDPSPANNWTELSTNLPPAFTDLAIDGFTLPATADLGDVVSSWVVVKNRGPSTAPAARLRVSGAYLRLLSAAPFIPVRDCCGGADVEIGRLLPGESREMELRFQVENAGLNYVNLELSSVNRELDPTDNLRQQLTRVTGPSGSWDHQTLGVGPVNSRWHEARQQLVALAPYPFPALDLLDPDDLGLRQRWNLPAWGRRLAIADDGIHAWVLLGEGQGVVRIHLDTGLLDRNYALQTNAVFDGDLAVPPGASDTVVVAAPIWNTSTVQVRTFRNGMELPVAVMLTNWWWAGEISLAPDNDRIFVSTGTHLRELGWTQDGLVERRNWDSYVAPGSVTYAPGRLVFNSGSVLNLVTSSREKFQDGYTSAIADPRSGLIYFGGSGGLVAHDDSTLALDWAIELPEIQAPIQTITPLGRHGFLLRESQFRLVPFVPAGPVQADLGIHIDGSRLISSTNQIIPLWIQIRNHSIWNAGELTINLDLSPGLEFVDDELPGGTNRGSVHLTNGVLMQTRYLNLRASTDGAHFVRAEVASPLRDPDKSNNLAEIELQVLPPPTFVVEDLVISEGSRSEVRTVSAVLSRSVSRDVLVHYEVVSDPPRPWNLQAGKGVFRFPSGTRLAKVGIFRGDSVPETDKTFQLQFSSADVALARSESHVTLLNDDFPSLKVAPTRVVEGNDPTNRWVQVSLSAASPFTVQASYRWVGQSAEPGVDFLRSSGSLVFLPGQTTASIPLAIVGDRLWENSETLYAEFFDLFGGVAPDRPEFITLINDDPVSPFLVLQMTEDDHVVIEFQSSLGANYRLVWAPSAAADAWEEVPGTSRAGTGLRMKYELEIQEGSALFRVVIE